MDVADRAHHQEEMARELALARHRNRKRMAAVRAPGERARCRTCDEDIEPGRLRVLPHTPVCAECAHAGERFGVR